MKILFTSFFSLVIVGLAFAASDNLPELLKKEPAWLQKGIKWERAPRDVNPNLSVGSAITLYFAKDGNFTLLSGTVYKQDHKISASVGDSESIYKGTWVVDGNSIHVTYRLVYHDIRVADEDLPGSVRGVDFRWGSATHSLKAYGSRGS
jgi:hypothetical protein